MTNLIDTHSPAYARRLVREINRLLRNGSTVCAQGRDIFRLSFRKSNLIAVQLIVGDLIHVTSREWPTAFADAYGRVICANQSIY